MALVLYDFENTCNALQVSSLAEAALACRERDKFDQCVRDVDKVTSLLLKLSEMLARADNAVASLPTSASDTERVRNAIVRSRFEFMQCL